MVVLSLECTSEYGDYGTNYYGTDDYGTERVEYGTNDYHFYQEDDPGCKVWFDREYSNEPTTKAKSWLRQNGHPETKAALCSAKAPIKGSDWISMKLNKNKAFSFYIDEEQPESKKICMTICDHCPDGVETIAAEKENQGTVEFCKSLSYFSLTLI